jgi:probable rRNA maturation factor
MEIDIQVDEQYAADVHAELIERAVAAVLEGEGISEPVELSVLVTSDAALHELNRTYRGVDRPTDVLSFADEVDAPGTSFVRPPDTPRYLGDIAISYERVLAQAEDYGHSAARELAYLTAHGVLHLLGYDHERGEADAAAMRSREEAAMDWLGLQRGS